MYVLKVVALGNIVTSLFLTSARTIKHLKLESRRGAVELRP